MIEICFLNWKKSQKLSYTFIWIFCFHTWLFFFGEVFFHHMRCIVYFSWLKLFAKLKEISKIELCIYMDILSLFFHIQCIVYFSWLKMFAKIKEISKIELKLYIYMDILFSYMTILFSYMTIFFGVLFFHHIRCTVYFALLKMFAKFKEISKSELNIYGVLCIFHDWKCLLN